MDAGNVVAITVNRGGIVQDLRRLADEIEKGERSATWAVVCWQDGTNHQIGRTFCGDTPRKAAVLGILSYVSHMVYEGQ